MSRRSNPNLFVPVLGACFVLIGGVVIYRPEESRNLAYETATRVSGAASELYRAAGWQEISKAPAESTRGYRAPQRFVKPKQPATALAASGKSEAEQVSYDDKSPTSAPFGGEASQRPQVNGPALSGPENSAKLRQLDGDTAPKLQPAKPREEAGDSKRREPAPSGKLNAPDIRKIRNPYAIQTADDGKSESKNEPALLELSGDTEAPVGAGLAPMPSAEGDAATGSSAGREKSVLKSRTGNAPRVRVVEKARRPSTATLSEAGPAEVTQKPASPPAPEEGKASTPSTSPEPLPEKPSELVDHHASNFQGVTPGESDEAALVAALGQPTSSAHDGSAKILRFAASAFQEVSVVVSANVVESISLSLKQPLPTKDVVKELGLSAFEPGLVTSADGYVLGQVYPERGVTLEFAKAENGVTEVEQIVLARVTAEPFLLRALDDKTHRYAASLRDLEIALRLDPKEPRAYWLKSDLLCDSGRPVSALRSIDEAIRLDSLSVGYRLTKAKVLLALGQHGEASRMVEAAMGLPDLPPQAKTRALCQQADLMSRGPAPDFEKGLDLYQKAIAEASAFAEDPRPATRQLARRVLIEGHLGVARCIAWSQLNGAKEASAKWNERARLLAETATRDEDVGDDIWLAVNRSMMQTHLGLAAQSDPERDISELQVDYQRILRAAADPAYRARVKWDFALAMTDASRLQSARGKHRAASQLADAAWTMLSEGIVGREDCDEDQFSRGMLLYQLGSIAAVAKENHAKAIEWYEQAIPLLERPLPESLEAQTGLSGLAFVGMGASYWEMGDQKQALALSELGAKRLQLAADQGRASKESLDLAYGNLESMYRESGDSVSAERVAKRALGQEKSTILR